MMKTCLHFAYCFCWIMALISFIFAGNAAESNYFILWGIVNYLLWRDAK